MKMYLADRFPGPHKALRFKSPAPYGMGYTSLMHLEGGGTGRRIRFTITLSHIGRVSKEKLQDVMQNNSWLCDLE